MTISLLQQLDDWFSSQCDGDWEHQFGINLETTDNPGWLMRVSLEGTSLEAAAFAGFESSKRDSAGHSRVICRITEWNPPGGNETHRVFEGYADAGHLNDMLRVFLDWVAK